MPFHPAFVIVALVIVLIIFGPGRLPELGAAVGKAMREFRKATTELTSEVTNAGQASPAAPPPAASPAPPVAVADPAPAPATGSESQATSSKN
ncbi:MAG TPA: twin-arginine translocase TatA/TatE family subunit [Candidatus Dormibacteraeota bacterium]|nr:twin-arginine translocase TatA/TatE family subunit [Candidatus Dormibacteraeota bacterium]